MSDDATLRALEARATPGPWTPDGDKICATAADALIPENILVAYYTGHDHRLGLKTTGHAADVEFIAAARLRFPTGSPGSTASAPCTPSCATSWLAHARRTPTSAALVIGVRPLVTVPQASGPGRSRSFNAGAVARRAL